MPVIPIVLSITAGICLSAGGTHLLFGLSRRPRDRVHITFALASLAIAGNALAVLAIHTADSVDAYVAAFKYAFGPTALLINVGILWFVAFYTRVRPRWFLLAMSLWFTGIIALQLVLPYGILFADVSGLRSITMPWGEQFVVGQATPHPWRLAVDLFFVVFFAFLLYATYRQYRRGDRGRASLLALTILLFLPSVVFDSLVDTGVINSIYISDIIYLVFVVLMSFRLYGEVIQTESELRQYRTKLEAMVDERTFELQQANDQLAREIAERMQAQEGQRQALAETLQATRALRKSTERVRGMFETMTDGITFTDLQGTIIDLNEATVSLHGFGSKDEIIGRNAFDLIAEGERAKAAENLQKTLTAGRSGLLEYRLLTKDGREFDGELSAVLLRDEQGQPSGFVALTRNITERKKAEQALRLHSEELATLNRIAQTLTRVTELPAALERVSEMIARLFDAQHTYIVLPSVQEAGLQVLVGFERASGPVGVTPLPVTLLETPYFNQVLNQAESLVLSDVQSLPIADSLRRFITSQQIQNALLVPLVVRGAATGLLAIANDQAERGFAAHQVRLAETIAVDIAATIENSRLFEQAQVAAVAEERSRLARELHDSVTQILFSVNLIALSLGRLWKRNPEMAARSTDELQRLTRGALAEMRTLLRELRPQTIAATELSTLLKQLSDGVSARHDIPVDLDVGQACELPPKVHVALYRIAQEALSNITKHAEASQVAIELICEAAAVQLTITDDGQGFDPDDVAPECMGLDIMRERAEAVGATMVITSQPGAGTSIVVARPIPETEGDADAKS
jgi:PAS domain S-box-containing protein